MFTTNAEFNELSFAIYRKEILHSNLKMLAKIYISVIYTHMVDFCSPSHNMSLYLPFCGVYLHNIQWVNVWGPNLIKILVTPVISINSFLSTIHSSDTSNSPIYKYIFCWQSCFWTWFFPVRKVLNSTIKYSKWYL